MKKNLYALIFLLVFAPLAAAQSHTYKVSVSQFVEHPALDAVLRGFQDQMTEAGIAIDYNVHIAQANMATAGQIAHQIMGEKPDLVLAIATPTAQACVQALKKAPHMQKVPLLFTAVTDPITAGLVKNLEKPGKNITGVSDLLPIDKHMAMVTTFYPGLKKLGIIYNSGEANSKKTVSQIREEGKKLGFSLTEATVSKSSDVYQAAKSLAKEVDAIFIPTDNTVITALESAIKVCIQAQTPLFCADVDSVARGAVAAMGFDYYKHGRQTGVMAAKLFAGQSPSETPVEFQEELSLHINRAYADRMGVKIPEELLKTADKIYE